MNAADWANTVLIVIAAVTGGLAAFLFVHGLKLLWQSRHRRVKP